MSLGRFVGTSIARSIARDISMRKRDVAGGDGPTPPLPVGGFTSITGNGQNNCQQPGGNDVQRYFRYDNDSGSTLTFTLMADSTAPGNITPFFAFVDDDGNVTGLVEGEVSLENGAGQNFLIVAQFDPAIEAGYTLRVIANVGGQNTYALLIPMSLCVDRAFTIDFTETSSSGGQPGVLEPDETLVFGLDVQTQDGLPYDLNGTVSIGCSGGTQYAEYVESSPPGGQVAGKTVFWVGQHFAAAEVKQYSATFQAVSDLTGLLETTFTGSVGAEGGFAQTSESLTYTAPPPPAEWEATFEVISESGSLGGEAENDEHIRYRLTVTAPENITVLLLQINNHNGSVASPDGVGTGGEAPTPTPSGMVENEGSIYGAFWSDVEFVEGVPQVFELTLIAGSAIQGNMTEFMVVAQVLDGSLSTVVDEALNIPVAP